MASPNLSDPWMRLVSEQTLNGMGDYSKFLKIKLLSFSRRCTLPAVTWLHLNWKHITLVLVFLQTIKETLAQVLSCEFCKVSKNNFSTEHLQTTASGRRNFPEQNFLLFDLTFTNFSEWPYFGYYVDTNFRGLSFLVAINFKKEENNTNKPDEIPSFFIHTFIHILHFFPSCPFQQVRC